jgi:hypothetical protein
VEAEIGIRNSLDFSTTAQVDHSTPKSLGLLKESEPSPLRCLILLQ